MSDQERAEDCGGGITESGIVATLSEGPNTVNCPKWRTHCDVPGFWV